MVELADRDGVRLTPSTLNAAAAPVSKRELRLALAGLMLALTLAALDQNIVGTAMPRIVSELGGLSHLSWVVTAFLLTSTATTPIYGKLSDIYGRKRLFHAAILIFLAGSALCGLAQSMIQLIIFRAVQGLGAGGLISLAQTTIADLVPPRERGRYQGLFTGVFAICSVAGPLLGGLITDALSWRWIFFVNVPFGIAALFFIEMGLRRPHRPLAHQIDYAGAAYLMVCTTCALLVLSLGGSQYSWTSPLILALAAAAIAFGVLLVRRERRAVEPLFAPALFENRVFVIAAGVMCLTGMGLFGAVVFLPLFFQLVLGKTASMAGLMMAPLMGGVITASIGGGRLVSRTGRYKIFPIIGLFTATVAFLTMAWAATADERQWMEAALVALGIGLGLVMPTLVVAIQNAVARTDLGIATSAAMFCRSLGSAVGVAVAGAIMTFSLHQLLPANPAVNRDDVNRSIDRGIKEIDNLPEPERLAVIEAYRHSIAITFLAGSGVVCVALIVVLFLPERPLTRSLALGDGAAGET